MWADCLKRAAGDAGPAAFCISRSVRSRESTCPNPHPPSQNKGARRFVDDFKRRPGMQSAFLDLFDVKRDPHHAVGIVPAEVGLHEAPPDDLGFFLRRSARGQQGDPKIQQHITR